MGIKPDTFDHNCVCDILLDILEAQEKVDPANSHCTSGCSTSLQELCGGLNATSPYTTIPVSLICKGTCEYFVGRAIRRTGTGPDVNVYESIAFRVVDVDPETCCATLELLQAVPVTQTTNDEKTQVGLANLLFFFLDQGAFGRYVNTGICITVDLDCFCGVNCHPAVTPGPFTG